MFIKLLLSLLITFNANLLKSQAPGVPQPHWCPPNAPYQGGPLIGPYGQDCTPAQGDCPGACPVVNGIYQGLTSTNGKIICGINFDCCTCDIIECNQCIELVCNGDSSCFNAKNIQISGAGNGATINCNGDLSCQGTIIQGTNIGRILCNGDGSCQYSQQTLICNSQFGCILECVGDNSCSAGAIFTITNSFGMSCSAGACQDATFILQNNIGGNILCTSYNSCRGSTITVDGNIDGIICNGEDACRGSIIQVINPSNHFTVFCDAAYACQGLQLSIMVNHPSISTLGTISCNGASSCENIRITVSTQLPLTVQSLTCGAQRACANARITKIGNNIDFINCFCATGVLDFACKGLTGLVDKCLIM